MTTIDLSKIKLPVDLPFSLPKFELRTVDLPSFDFSKLDFSKLDLSKLDLPKLDAPTADQVIEWFRDAVFAGTGLVAFGAERLAELQKQLVELVKDQVTRLRDAS